MSIENLVYLSSDQAFLDLRNFIFYINDRYEFSYMISSKIKWVAFRSYYGGTLAALLRMKYSDLIHMAVVTNPLVSKLDYHGKYN